MLQADTYKTKRDCEALRVLNQVAPQVATSTPEWLPTNPSRAFLVCLGAGPWKIKRREHVQQWALNWFDLHKKSTTGDLAEICHEKADGVFPLAWQNEALKTLLLVLEREGVTFFEACLRWKNYDLFDPQASARQFFVWCGRRGVEKTAGKCLWIFARDFLGIPAFPIDRHVERWLDQFDLPVDSWKMLELCALAGIEPNQLARRLFSAENPDLRNR